MIQGSQKEHSHVSWMEQGRNLGGSVGQNIGKTKRTKRTISTIRMMDSDGAGSSYMERLRSELFRKVRKYRKYRNGSRKDKGRKRNFCLEIHQQGFMSVTERNNSPLKDLVSRSNRNPWEVWAGIEVWVLLI